MKSKPETDDRFFIHRTVAAVVCILIIAASFFYGPYVFNGPVLCPLHGVAGVPCPACGLTRAFCSITQGDIIGALQYNAIAIPLFILFAAAPFVAVYEMIRRRRARFYGFIYSSGFSKVFTYSFIAYHVGRLALWTFNGTLLNDYIMTSWTYSIFAG